MEQSKTRMREASYDWLCPSSPVLAATWVFALGQGVLIADPQGGPGLLGCFTIYLKAYS